MVNQKSIAPGTKQVTSEAQHQPVMLQEVLALLQVGQTFVDGTLGLGGHAQAILDASPTGRLLGIDRDAQALNIAKSRLKKYGDRFCARHGPFTQVQTYLNELDWPFIDGMLLDLGVSSLQLDQAERGFSFLKNSALDMRMDLEEEVTARELLAKLSEKDLGAMFREYGEEKFSKRIAQAIVRSRQKQPIRTTEHLRDLVSRAVPFSRKSRIHPATRIFQALRIKVNRELELLEQFLEKPPDFIRVGGVLVILSYHSLEDRRVKWAFRSFKNFEVLTKKPLRPTAKEIAANPRARSAKLRAIKRIA